MAHCPYAIQMVYLHSSMTSVILHPLRTLSNVQRPLIGTVVSECRWVQFLLWAQADEQSLGEENERDE